MPMNALTKARILDVNSRYYGLSALQMMESAGRAVAERLEQDFGSNHKISVFCGTGNNGGDGFVAARYLSKNNGVKIYLLGLPEQISSSEAYRNYLVTRNSGIAIECCRDSKELPKKINAEILLECLSGTGAKGKPREPLKTAVRLLNKSKAKRVSLDLPCPAFKPDLVYSLGTKKIPKSIVLDIGIPKPFYSFTGPGNVKFLEKRRKDSHKGENGGILVIAGSKKYHGAGIFAARAASLFADLVFVLTEKENIPFVKKATPSIIVSELNKKNLTEFIERTDSILVGPGLSESKRNRELINYALKKFSEKKFVLDATALKLVNRKLLNKNCVLTPHAGEFKKLFKERASEQEVLKQAKKFNCLIVLKGSVDLISNGIHAYKNFSGNALLTAGGTGDVLAGTIAAFAAKNPLLDSALAGTFLTGFAGDLIAIKKSALNAETLLEFLPSAKKVCEEF